MAGISPIDLQKALGGIEYPTDRETLVKRAKENKADKAVTERLAHLDKERFDGPDDVSKAVFGK